jgi:predicted alpha/beta-fold hydrolase
MMMEVATMKIRFPLKYDRELFKLSDGGTIALDWNIDD